MNPRFLACWMAVGSIILVDFEDRAAMESLLFGTHQTSRWRCILLAKGRSGFKIQIGTRDSGSMEIEKSYSLKVNLKDTQHIKIL